MIEELSLPNKYQLNFELFFIKPDTSSSKFFPVYFIPCKLDEDDSVVPYLDRSIFYHLDSFYSQKENEDFFTKPKSSFQNSFYPKTIEDAYIKGYTQPELRNHPDKKLFIEMTTREAGTMGYQDLIVGYYDYVKNKFVQSMYLKDFYRFQTYSILDYYIFELSNDLYFNEDLLDITITNNKKRVKDLLSFKLKNNATIVDVVKRLKLSCLEGSFNNSYSDEVFEMDQEIKYILSYFIEDYDPNNPDNVEKVLEISYHLKELDIVDFYVTSENKKYVLLDPVIIQSDEEQTFKAFIGFNTRLIDILNDRI